MRYNEVRAHGFRTDYGKFYLGAAVRFRAVSGFLAAFGFAGVFRVTADLWTVRFFGGVKVR